MWRLTINKEPKGQQDLKVKALLREMAEYSYASNASEFENHFKEQIKTIRKTNNFSADLLFAVTPRNQKSVEVWKMAANGDFKHKCFTLDFIEKSQL